MTIANNPEEAREATAKCYDGKTFGESKGLVLQEFIQGTEMSAFFFVDTQSNLVRYFASGEDHKTRYEPDHV